MIAVGLDGREIKRRRVKARRRKTVLKSNVTGAHAIVVEQEDEWRAFYELPPAVREYMREVMPVDQSAIELLAQWQQARRLGASEGDFMRYLERMFLNYLNATASEWPGPRPILNQVPRYDPHRAP